MKKFMVVLLALVMVLGMTSMAFASGEKDRETSLTASATTITTGQSVTFTAVTLKHGSSFANPTWKINSVLQSEVLDSTSFAGDFYTTSRSFTFAEPGTYVVEYEIVMAAGKGKSNVQFVATDSVTITVTNPEVQPQPVLIRYEITNWTKGNPTYNEVNGNLNGYEAVGQLWAVYDIGPKVLVDANFNFILTQRNENLKSPEEINNIPVILID